MMTTSGSLREGGGQGVGVPHLHDLDPRVVGAERPRHQRPIVAVVVNVEDAHGDLPASR